MKTVFISIILLSAITMQINAQDEISLRKKDFNLEKGLAIQGYDPVAYFTQNKAVIGKEELSVTYQGVIYNFSSIDNKQAFAKNPSAYEPQYGGWCAYAMGKNGQKVEVDPGTFKIIDGKLYLFYNKYFNNTLKSWNKDEANLKAQADVNWQKFYHS
jgi:YHS domain-containing protein